MVHGQLQQAKGLAPIGSANAAQHSAQVEGVEFRSALAQGKLAATRLLRGIDFFWGWLDGSGRICLDPVRWDHWVGWIYLLRE